MGDAATVPGYKLYDNGSYPAMIGTQCRSVVTGELWKVDSRCLAELDKIIENMHENTHENTQKYTRRAQKYTKRPQKYTKHTY